MQLQGTRDLPKHPVTYNICNKALPHSLFLTTSVYIKVQLIIPCHIFEQSTPLLLPSNNCPFSPPEGYPVGLDLKCLRFVLYFTQTKCCLNRINFTPGKPDVLKIHFYCDFLRWQIGAQACSEVLQDKGSFNRLKKRVLGLLKGPFQTVHESIPAH